MIVYTSIYGGYDHLHPHPDHDGVDAWLCFTDNPGLRCDGWETVIEPARFKHPRLSAKWRKCHPPDTDMSVWVDGSVRFTTEWINALLAALNGSDWAMFRHPNRTSIIDEANVSERMAKYHGLPVLRQAQHYVWSWGWPDDELWASTTFARRHTPTVLQAGAAWFAENEHWTYQDQISLPPVLARYEVHPEPIAYSLWRNPWFRLAGHTRDD